MKRYLQRRSIFLFILIFGFTIPVGVLAASFPSTPYENSQAESEPSGGFFEQEGPYSSSSQDLLGGPPVLPPDPGVPEVPVGDSWMILVFLILYTVYRFRSILKKYMCYK